MKVLEVTNIVDRYDVYGCTMNFKLIVDGNLIDKVQVLDCRELRIPGTRFGIIRNLLKSYKHSIGEL